ncbi:uncharacterized protein LOC125477056 [Pyrus x bretschneideri]|uniref:uncharacterized protein LOC125477056 n=1 Tax=Pyrus x bretschneideri TaxID=225117 RepID=UPI00202DDCC1|nr:uncharacterized protein LOC125477056 [Pyrus x bretschneideri]
MGLTVHSVTALISFFWCCRSRRCCFLLSQSDLRLVSQSDILFPVAWKLCSSVWLPRNYEQEKVFAKGGGEEGGGEEGGGERRERSGADGWVQRRREGRERIGGCGGEKGERREGEGRQGLGEMGMTGEVGDGSGLQGKRKPFFNF